MSGGGYDVHDDGPAFVGIRFCQEWWVNIQILLIDLNNIFTIIIIKYYNNIIMSFISTFFLQEQLTKY